MRINLLPEEDRASLNAVQMGTVLFVITIVLISLLAFASMYLYWQKVSERDRLNSYQNTMESLAYYREQVSGMKKEIKQIEELVAPLSERLTQNQPLVDASLLLNRAAASAQASSAWLKSLAIQNDGSAPISGYAVDSTEITRFVKAIGQYPYNMVMGSTRWVEQNEVRLLEFDARIIPVIGGEQP